MTTTSDLQHYQVTANTRMKLEHRASPSVPPLKVEDNDSMPPLTTILTNAGDTAVPASNPITTTLLSDDDTPAGERLVNTTELLEQILLNLDNQTLLLSERANSQVKATIDGSLKLQRKLFFRLAPEKDGLTHGEYGVNPLARMVPNMKYTFIKLTTGEFVKAVIIFTVTANHEPDPLTEVSSWRRMYFRHGPLQDTKLVTDDPDQQDSWGPERPGVWVTSNALEERPSKVSYGGVPVQNEAQLMAVKRTRH